MLLVLTTSRRQHERQQRITALGLANARRIAPRGAVAVARTLGVYQAASVALTLEMAPEILAEQGIDPEPLAKVNATALLTGPAAADMIEKAATESAFNALVRSFILDAGRTASAVSNATRPAVTGYVRYLTAPSCGRCAVLAGRVYRYSTGFRRHPRCDCEMHPTNESVGPELTTDPAAMFERGEIRGLSKGDAEAIRSGADIGQVVNVRRKSAGLVVGSSVIERAGRLTPQGILRLASDRPQQLALLRQHRYIT